MQRKCVSYITTSLDGFIADVNNRFNFLQLTQELCKETFYKDVDVIVMGRKAYDKIKTLPIWPYEGKRVYVITHYLKQKEKHVTFVHDGIIELIMKLKKEQGKMIWLLGGSEITNIFIKENLIDEYIITIAPIILGQGTRLFYDDNPTVNLQLKEANIIDKYIQVHYIRK